MKLPVYFISDNHFLLDYNEAETERRNKLFNLFEHIKKTGGTLIIGGDFFDFWLQTFSGIPKYYDDIIQNLQSLMNKISKFIMLLEIMIIGILVICKKHLNVMFIKVIT